MIFPSRGNHMGTGIGWMTRVIFVALMLVLAGCSSPTEKANRFYEKGSALLEQGDLVKARIEFQNALQIKSDMTSAWYGLAQIAEREGDWEKLFRLLNKVVEQNPKHLQARLKLGRLMLAAGELDKALAASDATMALAKDDASVLALRAAVLYKLDDKPAAVEQANTALARDASNIDALAVLASERLAAGDANKAIEYLDRGLKVNEKNIALQLIKVQALESLANLDSAETVFRKLIAFYPDIRALRHILAQFYLSHGRKDAAEAEYRAVMTENPADVEARLDLVRFVNAVKGTKAATQELETLIAGDPDNSELKFALASLHQSQNNAAAAEAIFRHIIGKAGKDGEVIRAKGLLAASLLAGGDKNGAQALVKEVLKEDQRNEQGLLLKAGMAIDERNLEQAISDLRTILRDVPDSSRALLLLARAHELSGSPELAQEHYLKAFQASKLASPFGVAYGDFLLKRGQAARAESVAEDVLKVSPGDVPAMRMLAQARINKGDWVGAQTVADELRKHGGKEKSAEEVLGAMHAARKNYAESITAFRRAFDAAPAEVQPMVALVRSYVRAGKTSEAITFLDSVVQASPRNINARLLQGQLYAMQGNTTAAVGAFRAVINLQPEVPAAYVGLANMHMREGRLDEAGKAITEGLAAAPGDFSLNLAQAEVHEIAGRFEEAIGVYEQLYRQRPNADVVVNNLASLLADHRTDKASLNRAYELAQRFRRSDIPQFKDTLGWAGYRLGKASEAVTLIKGAVKQLPDMPAFRYHLGMSYLALNDKAAARRELEKALSLGGEKEFPEVDKVKLALRNL